MKWSVHIEFEKIDKKIGIVKLNTDPYFEITIFNYYLLMTLLTSINKTVLYNVTLTFLFLWDAED